MIAATAHPRTMGENPDSIIFKNTISASSRTGNKILPTGTMINNDDRIRMLYIIMAIFSDSLAAWLFLAEYTRITIWGTTEIAAAQITNAPIMLERDVSFINPNSGAWVVAVIKGLAKCSWVVNK
jgi:hypothetical protein